MKTAQKPSPVLAIEMIAADQLKLDPQNARAHTDRQIDHIARSISTFGFIVPAIVDADGKVLVGNGRVRAARKAGLTEVPVIRITHLTPAQARAFAIADNKLTDNSTWNERLLGEAFRDLALIDLDFSLEVTGFTMGEIDLKIEGLSLDGDTPADPDDGPMPNGAGPPISKPGDLWLLGKHRILCGDALERSSYDTLMAGDAANLVFTDPPYNVPIEGYVSGRGRIHHRAFAMGVGELGSDQFTFFLTRVFVELAGHTTSGSLHYICMDWRHLGEVLAAGRQSYTELKAMCVWVKDNGGQGSLYRNRHELVLVFKSGRARHRNNVELGRYGRNRDNVWEYPRPTAFGRSGEEGNLAAIHPTVKPIQLVADAMLDCSERGDIVLDPFLGSGTTLIAAERVGRICHAMELDPLYVDAAIRRWQRHSGQHAIHVTGEPFDGRSSEARNER